MKYLDDIVKYLSKEMEGQEELKFRQQLSDNSELHSEFELVNSIWDILKTQLSMEFSDENISRYELIAEIIAEQDIKTFSSGNESEKIKSFRKNLQRITNNEKSSNNWRHRIYIFSMSGAALITLMLILFAPGQSYDKLISNFYTPESEAAIHHNIIHTRSDSATALDQFSKQSYEEAMLLFETEFKVSSKNDLSSLCYGLSCYECGLSEKAISILTELANDTLSEYSNLSAWYLSLILTKEEQIEKSKAWLIIVQERNCQYSKSAKKILKKL